MMKKGIFFAIITAVISGFSIFYNKTVVSSMDPLVFNITHNGGVALLLSLFLLTRSNNKQLFSLPIKNWAKLVLIGMIGGGIPFILFFRGLQATSAIDANLIHKTLFIWVAVMAIPILGERLNIRQITGYLIILLGNLFIGGFKGFKLDSGEFMILAATLLWSGENILAKMVLKGVDSNVLAWGRMFFGTVFLIVFAVWQNKFYLIFQLSKEQIFPLLVSTAFLTGYVVSWYKALKFAPATLVTSILILATPITNILTAIFLTRSFPQIQLVNLILNTTGVLLIVFLLSKRTKETVIPAPAS